MAYGGDFERGGWHYKHIPATTLLKLLQQLPEGSTITCTPVQNLEVCDADGKQIGLIDIGFEELDLYLQEGMAQTREARMDENKAAPDVKYKITSGGVFYYPQNQRAFEIMRPSLCIVIEPPDNNDTFIHAFPTLTLSEE